MTKKEARIRQVRRQRRIMAGIFLLFVLILTTVIVGNINKKAAAKKEAEAAKQAEKEAEEKTKTLPEIQVDLEALNSQYAILAEAETGKIRAQKSADEKIYPASMTKIMTTLVALENIENLDQKVTISSEIYWEVMEEHPSMAGYEPEEEVTITDLLYGAMLPSGAECCKTLAIEAAGSEESFVELMNQKAQELGMENTHFTNSSGFHREEHYSTVKDIMILLRNAIENTKFYEIFTTKNYTSTPSEIHPDGVTFENKIFEALDMLKLSDEVTGGRILGGKTGYTENAGVCLASLAEVEGNLYILVTAKAEKPDENANLHVLDAVDVYNQIGEYLKEK